jgi:ribosomal protein S2
MSAWMLFSVRQDIWIINLFKTIYMFKIGLKCLKDVVSKGGPVWFVNLDKNVERIVKFNANRAGEFFLGHLWFHGMVSNFKEFQKLYEKLASDRSFGLQSSLKMSSFMENWFFSRFTWPRFLFVSNVVSCPFAVAEALSLGIYCLGIVDTNVKSQGVNIAIPGNDETSSSILFYNELVCNYILLWKFRFIILWLGSVRNFSRTKLLKFFSKTSANLNYKFNIVSLNSLFFKSLRYFFINDSNSVDVANVFNVRFRSGYLSLDKVMSIFSQNYRLFFIISRLCIFKLNIRYNSFLARKVNKRYRWRWMRRSFRNHFLKIKLWEIVLRNVRWYGFSTLEYLWNYINRRKCSIRIKDLWFSRLWSSFFLSYLSLFDELYHQSFSWKRYLRLQNFRDVYLKRFLNWRYGKFGAMRFFYYRGKIFVKAINRWNLYKRFLYFGKFSVFFYYFRRIFFYYLSFPLKNNNNMVLSSNNNFGVINLKSLKRKMKNCFKNSSSRLKKRWKKKKFLYNLDKNRFVKVWFRLGLWSFDVLFPKFIWEKLILSFYNVVPVELLFLFFDRLPGSVFFLVNFKKYLKLKKKSVVEKNLIFRLKQIIYVNAYLNFF